MLRPAYDVQVCRSWVVNFSGTYHFIDSSEGRDISIIIDGSIWINMLQENILYDICMLYIPLVPNSTHMELSFYGLRPHNQDARM